MHVLEAYQVRCVHVPCHEVVLIKVIQVGRLVVLGVYLVHKVLELDVACIRDKEVRTVYVLHLGQQIVLLLIAVHLRGVVLVVFRLVHDVLITIARLALQRS